MSLSRVAVFVPILLMGGIDGRLFREFAVTCRWRSRYRPCSPGRLRGMVRLVSPRNAIWICNLDLGSGEVASEAMVTSQHGQFRTSLDVVDISNWSSASAGVCQASVFRGLVLRAAATAAMSSALCMLRSVPFWKILAQRSVGVLVGAALPWAVRIAEIDLDASVDLQACVLSHLSSLIPSQRPTQLLRQGDDLR